jgi:hypothetical protein
MLSALSVPLLLRAGQQALLKVSQKAPLTQLDLSVQLARQAVRPQMKGEQSVTVGGWQLPIPSQVVALVWVDPVQLAAAPQAVVLAG